MEGDRGAQELRFSQRGAITGYVLGALTFLGGIALLLLTFKLAYDMFTVNPAVLLGEGGKTPLDLNKAVASLMGVLVRILLLFVMSIVGAIVTNRGIHLYVDSRHSSKAVIIQNTPESTRSVSTDEAETRRTKIS